MSSAAVVADGREPDRDVVEDLGEDAARARRGRPARTAGRGSIPTISSTPGAGHRLDEDAADVEAGAGARARAAHAAASRDGVRVGEPEPDAADVALVGEPDARRA